MLGNAGFLAEFVHYHIHVNVFQVSHRPLDSTTTCAYNTSMTRKRLSDFLRNSKTTVVVIIAVVIALVIILLAIAWNTNNYNETVRGTALGFWGNSPKLHINGQSIPFDTQVSNILIIGTDKREVSSNLPKSHRNNGQADFLFLLSINHREKRIRHLHIDRDTMQRGTVKSSSQLWTPFTMSRCLFIQ